MNYPPHQLVNLYLLIQRPSSSSKELRRFQCRGYAINQIKRQQEKSGAIIGSMVEPIRDA